MKQALLVKKWENLLKGKHSWCTEACLYNIWKLDLKNHSEGELIRLVLAVAVHSSSPTPPPSPPAPFRVDEAMKVNKKWGGTGFIFWGEWVWSYKMWCPCQIIIITSEGFLLVLHFFSSGNDSLAMADAIMMINRAADLCFSNKFLQAKAELEPWWGIY